MGQRRRNYLCGFSRREREESMRLTRLEGAEKDIVANGKRCSKNVFSSKSYGEIAGGYEFGMDVKDILRCFEAYHSGISA